MEAVSVGNNIREFLGCLQVSLGPDWKTLNFFCPFVHSGFGLPVTGSFIIRCHSVHVCNGGLFEWYCGASILSLEP